jgi:hypothetical protein
MNERIKELAEQAGYEKDMFGIGHWDMPECKKFAELIVEECVAQCWTVSELESKGSVVSECAKRIRKHFGVES